MVAGVLSDLAPQEEVAKSESGGKGRIDEAPNFVFKGMKEGSSR